MSVNANSSKQTQRAFRCPEWLSTAIRVKAIELGISDSEFIKTALRDKLREDYNITESTQLSTLADHNSINNR